MTTKPNGDRAGGGHMILNAIAKLIMTLDANKDGIKINILNI